MEWTTAKGSKIEVLRKGRDLIVYVNGRRMLGGFTLCTHAVAGDCLRAMIGTAVIPIPPDRLAEVQAIVAEVESVCEAYAAELVARSERHDAIERMRTRGFA